MSDINHAQDCRFWAAKAVEQTGYTDHQAQWSVYKWFLRNCESEKWTLHEMFRVAIKNAKIETIRAERIAN